ncbi:MAG: response regulator transcription factor [Ilumatobacteraceae bacterium]
MRILIDRLVVEQQPALDRIARATPGVERTEYFSPYDDPTMLVDIARRVRPDLMLLSSWWLTMHPLLEQMIELGGIPNARRVLAACETSDALKVKAAWRGYFDVLELGCRSAADAHTGTALVRDLRRAVLGVSRLDRDGLWGRVARPVVPVTRRCVDLTEVERDITELVCIGLRDHEIGAALHMSTQTVKNRLSAILGRCNLANRTELATRYSHHLLAVHLSEWINEQTPRRQRPSASCGAPRPGAAR